MGLLNSFVKLLNEDSGESLEKKLGTALDKIGQTVGTAVDKAELGIKKLDNAADKLEKTGAAVERLNDKAIKKIAK